MVNGKRLNFGISGLLYNSTVLFYDRQNRSLWSQLTASAVSGDLLGTTLEKLPFTDTTWGVWKKLHPDTRVLSDRTGHVRRYGTDPYAGRSTVGMFPVATRDQRLPAGERVLGVEAGGAFKAYPIRQLRRAPTSFTDRVGSSVLQFTNDPPGVRTVVRDATGRELPTTRLYWFVWAAFHPDTSVHGLRPAPEAPG